MGTKEGKKEFFILPKDSRQPFHLRPQHSLLLVFIAAALASLSFNSVVSSFLIWVAIAPLYLALRGRKDRGTFVYGFLFGVLTSLGSLHRFPDSSISEILLLAFSNALSWGFWTWITRKIHFYLLFPDVHTTIADAEKEQFLLHSWRLPTLIVSSSCLWTCSELLTAAFLPDSVVFQLGLSQSFLSPIAQTAAFTGIPGISFLILIANLTLGTLLENLSLGTKKQPSKLPILCWCSLFLVVLGANKVTHTPFKPDRSIQLTESFPVYLSLNDQKQSLPIAVIPHPQIRSSQFIREKVRDGAKLLVIQTQKKDLPYARFRALENNIPVLFYWSPTEFCFITPNGERTQPQNPAEISFQERITPTFYYKKPHFFSIIVFSCSFLILLQTVLHVYGRKSQLSELILANR